MSSDPNSNTNPPPSGGGMGGSAPLVTVASLPLVQGVAVNNSNAVASTTVGASDHPLAAAAPPPPPPPPMVASSHAQEPSGPSSSNNNAPAVVASTPVPSSTLPRTMTTASGVGMAPPPLLSSASGGAVAVVPKSLGPPPTLQQLSQDDMADNFLRGPDNNANALLRPLPLPNTETDLDRIRVLVERRAWGDVLSITTSLLKGPNSHFAAIYGLFLNKGNNGPNNSAPPATLLHSQQLQDFVEILLLQGHAWMQMRRYKELGAEIQEWSYCQEYCNDKTATSSPASSPASSWIPWNVHIFAAATMQYTHSDKGLATTALWKIRAEIQQQMPSSVLDLIHVEHNLFNVFCAQGEWRMALESLERVVPLLKDGAEHILLKQDPPKEGTTADAAQVWQHAAQCEIWSRQARILLQMGALDGAQFLLEKANSLWQDVPHSDRSMETLQAVPAAKRLLEQVEPQLNASLGLLQFAYKKFNLALEHFRQALQVTRNAEAAHDAYSLTNGYLASEWVGGDTLINPVAKHTLYSEVTTNLAVAALYTCRLQEAVHVMESLIRQSPSEALTERSALNLCTLYELSGDAASATRKKRTLQLIAKRFFLHDIGPESFRL